MRISYRKRNESTWKAIPNVIMPIAISDVADDSFDNVKFSFLVSGSDSDFENLKGMKPKTYIRITEADLDANITEKNTYYFMTTKLPKARIRKEVRDENDVIITPKLWQIDVNATELIRELEDTNMPNYTITQSKTQFFNKYNRVLNDRYTFGSGFKFSYNTTGSLSLSGANKTTINADNNNGVNSTQLTSGKISVRLNNIGTESYRFKFDMYWAKTAKTKFGGTNGIYTEILPQKNEGAFNIVYDGSDTYFKIEKNYYSSGGYLLAYETENITAPKYSGEVATVLVENGIYKIKSLGTTRNAGFEISLNKNSSYGYLVMDIYVVKKDKLVNFINTQSTQESITEISGFTNDNYVKAQIERIEVDLVSNELTLEPEPKTQLLEFVEKALHDYNFNRRNKVTLSDESKVLLSVSAKESEWSGYNFRELLVRAFKYVGALPYLRIDRSITHIKPFINDLLLDVDENEGDDENRADDDFFDVSISNAKNVISDTDFATETVIVSGGTDKFDAVTDTNASFIFNNAIYYISKAIIYAPDITFVIPVSGSPSSYTVKSNIGIDHYWDVSQRLLDNNLYQALPNVNFSSNSGRLGGILGQGNTISFTSGSRKVENISKKAPDVPAYNVISSNPNISEYAITEVLLCLAYEYLQENYNRPVSDYGNYSPNFKFDKIKNLELKLVYVPYFKEITTKFVSNKDDRAGLNYQKKFNISDRSIDYKESQMVLTNEMNKKGNIEKYTTVKYRSIDEVLEVGSIINGGKYVISSKRLMIHNALIECEYTLSQEMLNQNTDIGLSVEYDAYNVPYDYVIREVFIDNHLIFRKTSTTTYNGEPVGCRLNLIEDIFSKDIVNDKSLDKEIYCQPMFNYTDGFPLTLLMNIKVLKSRFSMILSGNFIDNYSAGNQRYENGSVIYSQPYIYTDYKGKISRMSDLIIGYRPNVKYRLDNAYDIKKFPYAMGSLLSRVYYAVTDDHFLNKDSREAIAINHHTYLESTDANIRFYNFLSVNSFGTLHSGIGDLTDDLDVNNVQFSHYPTIAIQMTFTAITNGFRARVSVPRNDYDNEPLNFSTGVVLLNTDGTSLDLVGIIKSPSVTLTTLAAHFEFYIYTTRYGKK